MQKQISTLWGIIIIIAVAIALFGGVFAYQYSLKSQTPTPNVQPNLNVQTQTTEPALSETEGWKTYINKEYGFEFKYPEDFIIYNAISNPLIKDIISFKDNKSLSCGIWSFPADDKDYSREKLTTDKKYERLEVNNVEIFKSAIKKELGGGKGLQMFLFSKNGEEFNLACHISDNAFNEGLSAFNQTLSTFRFTNSTNQTAGWKTYTNSQYGFEIKYPSEFGNAQIFPESVLDCNSQAYNNEVGLVSFKNIGINIACPNGVQNSSSYKGSKTAVIIAGRQAYIFEYTSAVGYTNKEAYVPLSSGDYLGIIHTFKPGRPADYSELLQTQWQNILSTFKFTE